jgi:hypothetical protein
MESQTNDAGHAHKVAVRRKDSGAGLDLKDGNKDVRP